MARIKIDDDFFSDFNIFTADELNEMDFFLSNMRFFEKGVLEKKAPETFEDAAKANSCNEKKDPGNCFFLIVPKSEQLPEAISRRAA